jgi:Uma2 family endonuclease
MSSTLIPPDLETFPNRYRWTVAECAKLAEEGRLIDHYEVIDGEVISKMSQNPPHRIAVILMVEWLMSLFGARRVQSDAPIALLAPDGVYNEPVPDVAVTHEPTTVYTDRNPGPDDLLLVVEVADSSFKTDLVTKSRLYARSGICEYWIIDLNYRQLHIHREPVNEAYTDTTVYSETDTVFLAACTDAPVTVADLLPPKLESL